MEGERIARALARIEAASARIEAAVRQRASTPDADSELQRRFDRLQQDAQDALEQIDMLIAELEG